ncbi:MAG: hypothetical protein LBP59_04120 [Planctomycetaceae bacterium]|nr:hypothetical protein [Planctomycetaceae bacterium]
MKIVGEYSFCEGKEVVERDYPKLLQEVKEVINSVDASICKTKVSKEKTMVGEILYSPPALNNCFKKMFGDKGWQSVRVSCIYPTQYYVKEYLPKKLPKGAFREMDFVKNKLGIEVQFGKYSFMVYNVAAKMTIFKNLGYINTGIEIVPVKAFADEMSRGVSYFEQFVWDLDKRGISNIDVPVLILGIDL